MSETLFVLKKEDYHNYPEVKGHYEELYEMFGVVEGDFISFNIASNIPERLEGQIKYKYQLGFVVYVDGVQYEVRKLLDIEKVGVKQDAGESVPVSKKKYYFNFGIGRVKYLVSFHDGEKKHGDGSAFYDIRTFPNKLEMNDFINELKSGGYVEKS